MKTRKILILTIGMMLTGSAWISAQGQPCLGLNAGDELAFMPGNGPFRGQAAWENSAQLNAEQKETLKSLSADHFDQVKDLRLALQSKKAQQKTLVESVNPDVKAIEKNVDEIAKLEAKMQKMNVAYRLEVKKILPEDALALNGRGANRMGKGKQAGNQGMAAARGQGFKGRGQQAGFGNGQGNGRGQGQNAFRGNGPQGQGPAKGQGFQGRNANCGNCGGNSFQGKGRGGAGAGMAQRFNGRGQSKQAGQGRGAGRKGFGQGSGMGRNAQITLSDDTRALLQKSRLQVSADTRDIKNRIQELRINQKVLLADENVNLKDVNKNIDEMAKLKAQVRKTSINARLDVLNQLSPEEREKVLITKTFQNDRRRGFRI